MDSNSNSKPKKEEEITRSEPVSVSLWLDWRSGKEMVETAKQKPTLKRGGQIKERASIRLQNLAAFLFATFQILAKIKTELSNPLLFSHHFLTVLIGKFQDRDDNVKAPMLYCYVTLLKQK
jgi:hypothetical protein